MTHCCSADATASDAQGNAGNAEGTGGAGDWVPVIEPENLPKGVRKEVNVGDISVLLFWYRNQIYAISARSPAEGAYSEGFIKAKFTQDYGIICPTSGSVFSLKDGSVLEWFPNNPVLRAIQPKPSPLPVRAAIIVFCNAACKRCQRPWRQCHCHLACCTVHPMCTLCMPVQCWAAH